MERRLGPQAAKRPPSTSTRAQSDPIDPNDRHASVSVAGHRHYALQDPDSKLDFEAPRETGRPLRHARPFREKPMTTTQDDVREDSEGVIMLAFAPAFTPDEKLGAFLARKA